MNDQVTNLIQIRKSLARGNAGKLAANRAFLDFIAIQKQLTAEFDKTWAVIREQMDKHDITKIEGDFGVIQYVPYPTYSVDGKVAPRFFKKVLDGAEIKHYMKKHSKAPAGVEVNTSLRFRKNIKEAF
jgi:hypothetical protein